MSVPDLERLHVHSTYDAIAPHFSSTRYKVLPRPASPTPQPWPKVASFLRALPRHSIVCDVGCGNGKYLHVDGCYALGVDRSPPPHFQLIQAGPLPSARSCTRGASPLSSATALTCPFAPAAAFFTPPLSASRRQDAAISIAVIHHFSTPERRVAAIAVSPPPPCCAKCVGASETHRSSAACCGVAGGG